ncbi:hypothetical protein [Bradyrhizobium xenonodulans]
MELKVGDVVMLKSVGQPLTDAKVKGDDNVGIPSQQLPRRGAAHGKP